MAPKQQSSSYTIAHFHELFSSTEPSWDSSDLTKGMWYFALEPYLPLQDKRNETLLTKGYVLTKSVVNVVSKEHLIIVRDKLDTRKFDFENPAPVDPVASLLAHDATAAAKIAAATAPSEADFKRFSISPEVIEELGAAMRDHILAT
eukprot:4725202-Prymnesium_polylepis.1